MHCTGNQQDAEEAVPGLDRNQPDRRTVARCVPREESDAAEPGIFSETAPKELVRSRRPSTRSDAHDAGYPIKQHRPLAAILSKIATLTELSWPSAQQDWHSGRTGARGGPGKKRTLLVLVLVDIGITAESMHVLASTSSLSCSPRGSSLRPGSLRASPCRRWATSFCIKPAAQVAHTGRARVRGLPLGRAAASCRLAG